MTDRDHTVGLEADRLAYDKAMVAEPVWNRMETAADAVSLPRDLLLHAGPAFSPGRRPPPPVENSACVAAVFEGLAEDFDEASRRIAAGTIRLAPAQDFDVVTPLATVVSSSMQLHAVYDAHRGRVRAFAPINGGSGAAARFGLRKLSVVEHLRWLNGPFCDVLRAGIAEGIALVPIAAESVRKGDDCHAYTPVATKLLIRELRERTVKPCADERSVRFMNSSPSLFLNLWMAAVKCALKAAEGTTGSTLVVAAGGNGLEFGIRLAGSPQRWITAHADSPIGKFDVEASADRALGAIGDSAIIDAFGLGAMSFHLSPVQQSAFESFMPDDIDIRRKRLYVGSHIGFENLNLRFGLSATAVRRLQAGPVISLGVLDRLGVLGRLGGGIYDVSTEIFARAEAAQARQQI
ncbi:MAG: DUF1116 domain-containing protein [Rhodobacteraceae bacterium]|nr:DUF1116 domain-containing protein [Paracoccaceae bacterium]